MVTKGGGMKTDHIHQDTSKIKSLQTTMDIEEVYIYDESVRDGVDMLQFY